MVRAGECVCARELIRQRTWVQVVVPTLPEIDPAAIAASEKTGELR